MRPWRTAEHENGCRAVNCLSSANVEAIFIAEERSQWVNATLARSLLAGVSKAKVVRER
jgi:hypothetical protein